MTLINSNFPRTRITERNGRYIYAIDEAGRTAQIPTTATADELAAVGLFERVDSPPAYDPATQRLQATGNWPGGVREYEVINLTLEEVKERHRAKIEDDFQTAISTGYDTGMGYSLAMGESDRTALAQVEQLVSKGLQLGAVQPAQLITLTDTSGGVHQIPAENLSVLMLGYGSAYQTVWTQRAIARQAINAALDIAEVLEVTL